MLSRVILFKNFLVGIFCISSCCCPFNNNPLNIQLVELKLWIYPWPTPISGLSRPAPSYVGATVSKLTHLTPPLILTSLLLRTTSQLLKNMLIAAKMTLHNHASSHVCLCSWAFLDSSLLSEQIQSLLLAPHMPCLAFACSFLSTVFCFDLWAPARMAWLTRRLSAQGPCLCTVHS